jgi:hypothetical protein
MEQVTDVTLLLALNEFFQHKKNVKTEHLDWTESTNTVWMKMTLLKNSLMHHVRKHELKLKYDFHPEALEEAGFDIRGTGQNQFVGMRIGEKGMSLVSEVYMSPLFCCRTHFVDFARRREIVRRCFCVQSATLTCHYFCHICYVFSSSREE